MKQQAPRITKDGVTVVKHLEFEDRFQDAISQLVKNSIDYTNKYAGDGTTTSTILVGEIIKGSYRRISAGISPYQIRKGLEIGRDICLQFLHACKRKVTTKQQLLNVAMIATNSKKQIAELIADTVYKTNSVKIEKSNTMKTSVEFYSGMKFVRGIEAEELVNTKQGNIVYNYPFILTSDLPLKNLKEILPALELAKKARKQLVIFAPEISESIKSTLIYNKKKNIIQSNYITVPPYGQVSQGLIKKISIITQSYLYNQYSDQMIERVSFKNFGKCSKIIIDKLQTKIEVQEKNETSKNIEAIIFVGGPNQTVLLQNYDHMVDALNSVSSAKKDGVVAGGGITYWRMAELLKSYQGEGEDGVKILAQALEVPRKKLMQFIPSQLLPLSGNNWEGFDLKHQKITDMFQAGILDSANVAKSVIIDSLSLCNVLVQVNVGISRIDRNATNVSLKDLNAKYKI